jgi:hypothetical protein
VGEGGPEVEAPDEGVAAPSGLVDPPSLALGKSVPLGDKLPPPPPPTVDAEPLAEGGCVAPPEPDAAPAVALPAMEGVPPAGVAVATGEPLSEGSWEEVPLPLPCAEALAPLDAPAVGVAQPLPLAVEEGRTDAVGAGADGVPEGVPPRDSSAIPDCEGGAVALPEEEGDTLPPVDAVARAVPLGAAEGSPLPEGAGDSVGGAEALGGTLPLPCGGEPLAEAEADAEGQRVAEGGGVPLPEAEVGAEPVAAPLAACAEEGVPRPLPLPLGVPHHGAPALPLRAAVAVGDTLAVPALLASADTVMAAADGVHGAVGERAPDGDGGDDEEGLPLAEAPLTVAPPLPLPSALTERAPLVLGDAPPERGALCVAEAAAEGGAGRDALAAGEALACAEVEREGSGERESGAVAEFDGVPVEEWVPLPLPEAPGETVARPVADPVALPLPHSRALREAVRETLGQGDALGLPEELEEAAGEREAPADTLGEAEEEAQKVGAREAEGGGVGVAVAAAEGLPPAARGEGVAAKEGVPPTPLFEAPEEGVGGAGVLVAAALGVAHAEELPPWGSLGEGVAVPLPQRDATADAEGDCDGAPVALATPVPEGQALPLAEELPPPGDAVAVAVAAPLGEAGGDTSAAPLREPCREAEAAAVGVAAPPGLPDGPPLAEAPPLPLARSAVPEGFAAAVAVPALPLEQGAGDALGTVEGDARALRDTDGEGWGEPDTRGLPVAVGDAGGEREEEGLGLG